MNNRGVIAGEVSLFVDLGPDEAQEVVQVMSEARLAYQGNAAPTVLSALADRFNALGEEVNSLKHLDSTMEATTSSRSKQTARALATQTGRPPARCWQ